jgi:hypothetical protein
VFVLLLFTAAALQLRGSRAGRGRHAAIPLPQHQINLKVSVFGHRAVFFLQGRCGSCQNLELITGAWQRGVCLEFLLVFIFVVWDLLVHFVIYFKIIVYECKFHIYMVGLTGLYDCQW